jgi:hypothetical protein
VLLLVVGVFQGATVLWNLECFDDRIKWSILLDVLSVLKSMATFQGNSQLFGYSIIL